MDLEVAMLNVKNGDAAGLMKVMNEVGIAALSECPGCHSVKAMPGIENPGTVLLLLEWDSVAAHEAAKSTEAFGKFIKAAGPFIGEGSVVQHFRG